MTADKRSKQSNRPSRRQFIQSAALVGAGFWVGMLESNCCIEAEWLLAMHVLGVEDASQRSGIIRGILNRQRADGSWEVYHDAPMGDINATVECYAALRACGHAPEEEALVRARNWILSHGGLARIRVFTRFWLALIGEWPWQQTPNIPPELVVLSDKTALIGAENIVPLYRRNELNEQQVLALNEVAGVLDTGSLADMRRQVVEGKEPGLVADAWLDAHPLGR